MECNGVDYEVNKMLINRHSTSHSLRTMLNYCDILTLLKWCEKQNAPILIYKLS